MWLWRIFRKSKKVTKYVYGYENDISRINTLKKKGKN